MTDHNTITLYTTAGCHLCDLAYHILMQSELTITQLEIGDDDGLVERYGMLIPVVKFADNSELNWPFDLQGIATKVRQLKLLTTDHAL